jgi:peptidoglycan/xylan/chitin deacetylase (PgdA/CDA1 family)
MLVPARHPLAGEVDVRRAAKSILFWASAWSGVGAVIARRLAACGVILVFHEMRSGDEPHLSRATPVRVLEFAVRWLRGEGWEIVDLAEGLRRLEDPGRSSRFAVLTFDDGYRDLVCCALPVLSDHVAPFTAYIPTGAVTKELYSWWLGLREMFLLSDSVTIDAMGRRFECPTLAGKRKAIAEVENWVSADYRRASELSSTFRSRGICFEQLNRQYFLDDRELQALAAVPLVSIGAHTTSHPALATLEREVARREMADNRAYLENLTQRPVVHFANPYGSPAACGRREADLARQLNFSSAVTTRHGHLMPDHGSEQFMLPRISIDGTDSPTTVVAELRGVQSVLRRLTDRGQPSRSEAG